MPKIVAPLTANGVDKYYRQKVDKALSDGAQPGLTLRIRPSGASWSLVAGGPTGRRRFTLGSYPEIGLAQARQLAQEARERHRTFGPDSVKTLGELVEKYGQVEGHRMRTWDEQRRVSLRVFQGIWESPCRDLNATKIQRIIDTYPSRTMVARALGYIRPVLKWGKRRGYVDIPITEVEPPKGANNRRDRVLSPDEVKRVVRFLHSNINNAHYKIMWFLLLTACRREEIADMTWDEIEFGDTVTLRVPVKRSKNKIGLTIPLPSQAVELLGPPGTGRVFPKANNWTRYQLRIMADTDTSGWHRHDLRRTTATIAGGMGFPPHVVDAMLGHKNIGSVIHSTYNLSRYLPEHRQALQTIADYYCRLTE